jgi:hypothetical protein
MLQQIREIIQQDPNIDSYRLSLQLDLGRVQIERYLQMLEDMGEIVLEYPAMCESSGSGCGTAAKINNLATNARAQKLESSPNSPL